MIIIATHAALINGKIYEAPSNILVENFIKQKKDFVFLRHYMNGERTSEIHEYIWGEKRKEGKLFVIQRFSLLRYSTEVISTFLYVLFLKHKNIVYIWVDPLNALAGFLLKRIQRIKKNIFYTPDYSPRRFKNNILNKIYHRIDEINVFWSDQVWNVSSRIYWIRKDMWLNEERNMFMPNIPWDIWEDILRNIKNKFHLITLWAISEQLDFVWIFDTIKSLRTSYPEILLKIVGNWPKEIEYRELVKKLWIEDNVIFLWYLDHEKALEEISKSWVGLALYNWNWEFNYYGDSMKCREYFAIGLPVLTTDTHSTVMDIKENNTWVVSEMNVQNYAQGLEDIFEKYDVYSHNSAQLWKIHTEYYLNTIKGIC